MNGAALTLTYDEALDTASVPAEGAFAVEVNGAGVSLADTAPVAIDGSAVTLTLANAVAPGDSVTVSYTAPATNPILDAAGNEAADLSNRSASNVTPGIVLSPAALTVAEGGSATYTVRLNSQPSGTVTVMVTRAPGGSGEVGFDTSAYPGVQTSLSFTATNWSTPQTVTVSAAADTDAAGDTATLTHTASGGGYDAQSAGLAVTVTDLTPGIVLSTASLTVAEDGSASYTVRLNSQPSGTVTVTVARAPGGSEEVGFDTDGVAPGDQDLLTFTGGDSGNWRTPQTVTVRAATDADGDADTATLTHTASGGGYNAHSADLAVRVTDAGDMTAPMLSAATVNGASLVLTYDENLDTGSVPGSGAFAVRVNGTGASLADTGPVAVSGMTVTLTLASAAAPGASVTLDYAPPAGTGAMPIQDPAGNAAGALSGHTVTNLAPGVLLSPDALTVAEGGSGTYTVKLAAAPGEDVTVAITSDNAEVTIDDTDGTMSGVQNTLTFTASDWSTAQTVTVRAADDADADTDTATLTHAIGGASEYDNLADPTLGVTVTENDKLPNAPAIDSVTGGDMRLTVAWSAPTDPGYSNGTDESHTDNPVTAYDVRHILTSATDKSDSHWTVVDDAWTSGGGDLEYAIASLTDGQSYDVQVRAVTQAGDGPWSGTSTGVARDTAAPGLSAATVSGASLVLTFDENLDTGSVPGSGAFEVTVNGMSRTVSGVAIAGSEVTLTLAPAVVAGDAVTVSYTVPGSNPVQDAAGNDAGSLSNQAVTNVTPGIVLSESALTVAEGGSGTYTVKLAAAPGGDVTVAITSDNADVTIDDTDGGTTGVQNTLTFTTLDWSTAQTVTVRAAEDDDDWGGDDRATLTHAIGGAAEYAALANPELPVTVDDNDTLIPRRSLVSNLGQSSFQTAIVSASRNAQRFTTGDNAGGYLVTTVQADVTQRDSGVTPRVRIHAANGNSPGAVLYTLSNPASFGTGRQTWTAPSGATLDPGTRYFVVFTRSGGNYKLRTTLADGEDGGGASGWSIDDGRLAGSTGNSLALKIRVHGAILPDVTAPALSAAAVNGATLTLTYDEPLDATSVPAETAFEVMVAGVTRSLADTNPVAISGKVVTLTLASAVGYGDTVTLDYAVPGTNPIKDPAGNEAAVLDDRAVTNSTPMPSGRTLVGNLGRSSVGTATVSNDREAQQFTTGPNAGGYTVSTVLASVAAVNATPRVRIHAANGNNPGAVLYTLTNPASFGTGQQTWTAPAGATLDPGTRYFVVFSRASGSNYRLRTTFDDGEDGGGASGWSIANDRRSGANSNQLALKFRVTGTIDPDRAAPELADTNPATVNGASLVLTWNEALDAGSVPAADAFTVEVNDSEVDLADAGPVAVSGRKVTLTLASAVVHGDTVKVSYAVPATDPIQDAAGNHAMALTDQAVTNETPETTPPELADTNPLTVNGAALVLTYNEALDTNSVPASGDISVKVGGIAVELADTNPVAVSGSAVTLTLTAAVAPGAAVTVSYTVPTGDGANPIRDAAGNNAAGLSDRAVTNITPGVLLSVSALTVAEGGSGTYTVALAAAPSGDVTVAIASDNADVTIDDTDGGTNGVQNTLTFTTSSWSTAQTVTVRAADDADAAPDTATLTHTIDGASEYDNLADPTLGVTVTENDKLPGAPSIGSVTAGAGQLTVAWSAPTDPGYSNGTDESHTDNAVTAYDVRHILTSAADKSDSHWTVVEDAWTSGGGDLEYAIASLTAGQSHDVQVRAVTQAGDGPWSATSTGTPSDSAAPSLSTAAVNGAALVLTYDEALDTTHEPAAGAFTVKVNGAGRTVSDVGVAGSAVTLTLASAVTAGQTVTVSYALPAAVAERLQDAVGNEAAALTDQAVTNATGPPTLSTATVTGAALVLTYSEPLDTSSVPAAGAFRVEVNDAARGVSNVAVAGRAVTLTLASAVTAGQTVTLDYTAPGTNPIQDADGNDAADLSDRDVINALTPAVTITRRTAAPAQAATVTEGATVNFTISASPRPSASVNVRLRRAGGAAFGLADGTVSVPLSTDRDLNLSYSSANDALDDADSDFTVTVLAGTGYRVGTPSSATVTIEDDDKLAGAPSISSVTAGMARLTVAWSAPADPGYSNGTDDSHTDNAVTAYDVRHILSSATDKSDSHWTVVDDAWTSGDLEHAIASLTNGQSHDVQVRAVTRAGDGPWSGTSTGTPRAELTAPSLSTASVNGAVLVLTYDEALDTAHVPAAGAFTVKVNGAGRTVSDVGVAGSAVTLTLASAVTAGQTVTVSYALPAAAADRLQDAAGNEAAALADQAVTNSTPDGPLVTIAADAATVTEGSTAAFTVTASAAPASALGVKVAVAEVSAFGVSAGEHTVTISAGATSGSLSIATAGDTLDEPNAAITATVKAGTGYALGTTWSAAATIQDDDARPGAPSITSVTAGEERLTVAWSAPLDPGWSDGTEGSHTDNPVTAYDVRHILTSATDKSDGQWTVTDDAWSSGNLQYAIASLAAGQSHDVQVRAVTRAGDGPWSGTSTGTPQADTTVPTLADTNPLTVNGAALVLTYDEALDTGSVPARTDFAVRVGSSARAVSNVAVSGSAVTLTLASAVTAGQVVTVSYTAAAANPIQDAAGNDAANLVNQAVTNATPGVLLSRTSLTVAEGGSGTYTVRLNSRPSGSVTVTIASGDAEVTVDTDARMLGSQTTLVFTTSNWSAARTVTVIAAADDDTDDDNTALTHVITGASAYDALDDPELAVTVTDDDRAGLTFSPSPLTVDEGAAATYTVVLDSKPGAGVTVTITSDNTDVAVDTDTGTAGDQDTLDFTRDNWNTPQRVTVSAIHDGDTTDDDVTLTHALAGASAYAALTAPTLALTVDDDDVSGTPPAPPLRNVPRDWALNPFSGATDKGAGRTFRLLFITSGTRNAQSGNINDYNAFVQNLAAAGHDAIRGYGGAFRAVGSTAGTDARGNTATSGGGMPIYWLGGAKVADSYGDFYDGTWDSYAGRNEQGTSHTPATIWTGTNNDGSAGQFFRLGWSIGTAKYGELRDFGILDAGNTGSVAVRPRTPTPSTPCRSRWWSKPCRPRGESPTCG